MIGFQELVSAIHSLEIGHDHPVIAHASLSAFGRIQGGPQTLLYALLHEFKTLIMPSFTYKTMLVPEIGPPNNGIKYGDHADRNLMAEFFTTEMPSDRLMGILSETLRTYPTAQRSSHPILSFCGVNADRFLQCQTLAEPLGPIRVLTATGGWVLLLGVDHTVNTSIHYAEQLAGRKQFVRWALTLQGVVECPGFPGCSDGFEALAPKLVHVTRQARVGKATVQAILLADLIAFAVGWVEADPTAMLCKNSYCERCTELRCFLVA
jgi:aminoglycoside 3-N-acetyltransferase